MSCDVLSHKLMLLVCCISAEFDMQLRCMETKQTWCLYFNEIIKSTLNSIYSDLLLSPCFFCRSSDSDGAFETPESTTPVKSASPPVPPTEPPCTNSEALSQEHTGTFRSPFHRNSHHRLPYVETNCFIYHLNSFRRVYWTLKCLRLEDIDK